MLQVTLQNKFSSVDIKRTRHFLMKVWEAAYRTMISSFLNSLDPVGSKKQSDLHREIVNSLLTLPECSFTEAFRDHLIKVQQPIATHYQQFKSFLQSQARTNGTRRFWIQFVFEDVMAYVRLFLSIRSGDWDLRMASMKKNASCFYGIRSPD